MKFGFHFTLILEWEKKLFEGSFAWIFILKNKCAKSFYYDVFFVVVNVEFIIKIIFEWMKTKINDPHKNIKRE